ncbi:FAST kinase domain-containing protein 1, mitochondrial [Octopus sinensis]|uniref:FAST kinase domain-containing protein 1, mitochondrial n=1 Tax=Octopus sinensis TaxID=2607531 RepID=A0A6P7SEM5_9MOLL|nr:FAST kinase domain-containing protein 1, mitochondrial [Octopus sinensis]
MIPTLTLRHHIQCIHQLKTVYKWTTCLQLYHVYTRTTAKRLPFLCSPQFLTSVRYNGQYQQVVVPGEGPSSVQILEETRSLIQDKDFDALHETLKVLPKQIFSELHTVPWLHHHNQPIAMMQLLLNNKSDLYLGPIKKDPAFINILQFIDQNLEQIPDEHIPGYFHGFLFLGTDCTSPIIHKLLHRLQDSKEYLNLNDTALICEALRIFPRGDFKVWSRVLKSLDIIFKQTDISSPDFDVYNLSRTITNIRHISTSEKLNTVLNLTHQVILNNGENLNILQLGSCLRMYRHLSFLVSPYYRDGNKENANCIVDLLIPKLPMLTCANFADVCHVMKVMGIYDESTSRKFQKRALEILHSETLKISELVNLCYAFNYMLMHNDRYKVESALYKDLSDADVLLLSNIADILIDIKCNNSDLITYYFEMIKQHIDNLKNYVTRFFKVFRFVNRNQISHQDSFLFQEILNLLNSQQGLSVWTISTLSSFLLPQCKPVIPELLMNKLLAIIPQSGINDVALILSGINKMKRPWVRQMYQQVLQLQTALYQNVEGRLDEVQNIDVLIQMIQVLYVKNEIKETVLLENLMKRITDFMDSLNLKQFRYILNLLFQVKYIQPDVLNKMTEYLLNHEDKVNFSDFSNFVRVISHLGFHPKQFNEFESLCERQLERHIMKAELPRQLMFTNDLCKLQIFIDRWLSQLFSYEFIEKIDEYIDSHPQSQRNIKTSLMLLNRCVVLECPHLDIPWFHEEFCQKTMSRDKYNESWIHQEIESALTEALGSSKFYRASAFTPYFFVLDFECLLDVDKKPINISLANELHIQEEGYQRVAICIQLEKYFSVNSRNLLGSHQMKQRQLEILGYKTVEIPFFEWNSMALSDWPEKVEYLSKKIFR